MFITEITRSYLHFFIAYKKLAETDANLISIVLIKKIIIYQKTGYIFSVLDDINANCLQKTNKVSNENKNMQIMHRKGDYITLV